MMDAFDDSIVLFVYHRRERNDGRGADGSYCACPTSVRRSSSAKKGAPGPSLTLT
jgi:hypothetical protein